MHIARLTTTAAAAAALIVGLAPLAAQAQTAAPTAPAAASPQTAAPAPATPAEAAPAAATAAPATPAAPPAKVVASGDLVSTLKASGQFTTLVKGLDATNLTGVIKSNPNLTLFAPTDAAFAALPPGKLNALLADKVALQKLLTHHVINAKVDSTKIKGAKGPVTTVAGDMVQLDGSGEAITADNATVVQTDVMATNGVLHVVDKVLMAGAAPVSSPSASTDAAPTS